MSATRTYPPSISLQTLASGGKTAFGAFGVAGVTEVTSPARAFGMIVGESGVGKTSLYRDYPGALILNFDLHSMPVPHPGATPPLCQIFPVVKADGTVVDAQGKVFRPTWDAYRALMDKLLDAGRKDQPRPTTIVWDTVTPTVRLKQAAYAKSEGVAEWEDLPEGKPRMKAYGKVYDSYPNDVAELREYYGVHLIAHLRTYEVSISEVSDAKKLRTTHNMPDKIFDRLFPQLEFLLAVELAIEPVHETDSKGKITKYNASSRVVRYLVNLTDRLKEMSRARVQLPERIVLPAEGAFQLFERTYLEAAGQQSQSA